MKRALAVLVLMCVAMPAAAQTNPKQLAGVLYQENGSERIEVRPVSEVITGEQIKYLDDVLKTFLMDQSIPDETFSISFMAFSGGLSRIMYKGQKGSMITMDTGSGLICYSSVRSSQPMNKCWQDTE